MPRQQLIAQTSEDRRGLRLGRLDRLSIHAGRAFVGATFKSALARLASDAASSSSRPASAASATKPLVFLPFAFLQQEGPSLGCVRARGLPAPWRAVGEREAQLPRFHPSQSIFSFAPPAFAGLQAPMERSDFRAALAGSSSPPSRLPSNGGSRTDLPGKER